MRLLNVCKVAFLLFGTTAILQSCNSDDDSASGAVDTIIPSIITISEASLFPEGIDFNTKTNEFMVGSVTKSEVGVIDQETGVYSTFVTDPKLASVVGIYTDEIRNRLLVASGNLGFSENSSINSSSQAYLGIYNLESGELIEGVSLEELLPEGSSAFANDITVDVDGNIYVTDSFSSIIYKVDGTTFEGSIFLDGGNDFTPATGQFGLNGIVYVDGFLIVCKLDDGTLFRIPLTKPEDYIKINASAFIGADGLEVNADGDLVVVENGLGQNTGTHVLTSENNWESATEVAFFNIETEKFPTTATLANDGNIYVLNSYLGNALAGDLSKETFEILRIE